MTKQPELREIPVNTAMDELLNARGGMFITVAPGQWDDLIAHGYDDGWTLIEIADEIPVKAYRKES